MMSARSERSGKVTAAALLATVSLLALLCNAPAAASDCSAGGAAPPADIATPTMVFDTLRARTNAQLLSMGFLRKPVEEECAWIYEVKVLTASGSVVELDFKADDLDLVGARGPTNDRDAVALVKGFGGDAAVLNASAKNSGGKGSGAAPSGKGGGDDGGGEGGGGGSSGEGGEGGNSGSGSGGEGGEGGNGGSGGSGGGEGGEGGGDD
jgi:hypothetical protein